MPTTAPSPICQRPHIELSDEYTNSGEAPCGCLLAHNDAGAPVLHLCHMHEAAPALRSALELIGKILDPGESAPEGMAAMLRKIGKIQAAALASVGSDPANVSQVSGLPPRFMLPKAENRQNFVGIKAMVEIVRGQLGDLQENVAAMEVETEGEFENLPEEHQVTATGQRLEATAHHLREARRTLEGAARDLTCAVSAIEAAAIED